MKERLTYLDVAKGLAILCVIIGHFRFLGIPVWAGMIDVLQLFHLPLFIIVASLFFDNSNKAIVKRLSLVRFYILVCAIEFLVDIVSAYWFGDMSVLEWMRRVKWLLISYVYGCPTYQSNTLLGSLGGVGPVWFLLALPVGFTLYGISSRWKFGRICLMLLTVSWFLLSYKAPRLPWCIEQAMLFTFYILVGQFLRNHYDLVRRPNCYIAIIGCVCLICGVVGNYRIAMASFGGNVIAYLLSVFAVYFVLYVSSILDKVGAIRSGFGYIGRHTLAILCIHSVLFHCFDWHAILMRTKMPSSVECCLLALFHICVPILGVALFLLFSRRERGGR